MLIRGGLQAARSQLLVGFDPVRLYLARLQQRFGHLGLFCAGLHGSCTIAVRWLPQVGGLHLAVRPPAGAPPCQAAGGPSEARAAPGLPSWALQGPHMPRAVVPILTRMQALGPRAFKPEEAACTAPADASPSQQDARPAKRRRREDLVQRVAADQAAVLLEVARMGAGLVQGVQLVQRD